MGLYVNRAWQAKGYAREAFPEIACAALDDDFLYDLDNDWMYGTWEVPRRTLYEQKASEASDAPTLFTIEARLYTCDPAAIVDEAFDGASRIRGLGVALRTLYSFEIEDPFPAPRCRLGALSEKSAELLLPVDPAVASTNDTPWIESIVPIDQWTIRFVIRTPPWQIPERWRYYRPSLALLDPTTLEDKVVSPEPTIATAVSHAGALEDRLEALRAAQPMLKDRGLRFFVAVMSTQLERRFVVELVSRQMGVRRWQFRFQTWMKALSERDLARHIPEPLLASFSDVWPSSARRRR